MKAVIVIALGLLVAADAATFVQYCVDLTRNDVICDNYRSNWPTKVCSGNNSTYNSSFACDPENYSFWNSLCPVKNVGNQSFCEGTGYGFGYMPYAFPCLALTACNTDADCNQPTAPIAEAAPTTFQYRCYDCCTFCFDESTCTQNVNNNYTYTKSSNCLPCHTEPTSTTTPGNNNTPAKSAGAVIVVSGIVLAFAALLSNFLLQN